MKSDYYGVTILLAGLGIIISNSYAKSLQESSKEYANMLGVIFWGIVAYIYLIERSIEYQLQVIVAIMAIFIGQTYGMKYIWIAGWLLFGYLSGLVNGKVNNEKMALGMSAAALMIASESVFLPMQKTKCRVEGPGMAFKGVAWALIAYVNM